MPIHEKIEKSIVESIFFSQFKNKPFFFFWSIINMWFHIIGNYTSVKINHSNRIDCPKYLNKNQALCRHDSWVILGLYFRHSGKLEKLEKNVPNNLGYTENISKSPTPHSASDKVFRLIFIQPFYAINLIWWSIF